MSRDNRNEEHSKTVNEHLDAMAPYPTRPLKHDPVRRPAHYTAYQGLEIIDLTEQMNFNRGNAVKYITRAGIKSALTELEDLEKAKWYIEREIDRLKRQV